MRGVVRLSEADQNLLLTSIRRLVLSSSPWDDNDNGPWPDLEYPAWQDTALTLQLWTQIIGKIRLSLTPWRNHGWHVPLYITARGLGTSAISAQSATFDIEFDFVDHLLVSRSNSGTVHTIELKPMTVASFYGEVMAANRQAYCDRARPATLPLVQMVSTSASSARGVAPS